MLKKNIAANVPRRGLYKEGILKSFRFFYRSHYSLPNQRNEIFRRRRPFLVFIQYLFPRFFLNNAVFIAI